MEGKRLIKTVLNSIFFKILLFKKTEIEETAAIVNIEYENNELKI
jgi:hypothetical protein